jgi:hypothetical protein
MYLLYLAVLIIFVVALFSISSRVRKAARLAFEAETIDAGEFVIVKPEGFINPLNDESEFAFEAYSKDFGKSENEENRRQAEAFVTVKTGEPIAAMAGTSAENPENGDTRDFYKVIGNPKNQNVYELKISVLKDFLDDYQSRVDEMLESFRLK